MKKIISVCAAVFMIMASVQQFTVYADPAAYWTDDGIVAEGFAGGTGTEADPYRIATAGQLAYLAKQTDAVDGFTTGKYFSLTADIDLADYIWTPIGNLWSVNVSIFQGVFNGNDYKVFNMAIINAPKGYAGLFGLMDNSARVFNTHIVNCYIDFRR
jgi:hypothetical protein